MNTRKRTDAAEPEQLENLKHRAISGVAWLFSGSVVQVVLQLLVLMLLARLLQPAAFGIVAAALVAIRLAEGLSKFGIAGAIVQKPSLDERDLDSAFGWLLASGLTAFVVLYLAAPRLATALNMRELEPVTQVLALSIPISNAADLALALLRRHLRFKYVASATAIGYATGYGVVGVGLAVLDWGVWALVGAYMAETFVKASALLAFQPHRKRVRIHLRTLARLLRFGGGLTTSRLANTVAMQVDNLVVGRWLGAEALGLYARAYNIAIAPAALLAQDVQSVMFSAAARLEHDRPRLALAYKRALTSIILVTLPASVVLAMLASEIILLVLGPQWSGAVVPLTILSFGLSMKVGANVSFAAGAAVGAVYGMASRHALAALAVLVGALAGQLWGIGGVCVGVLAAIAINYALAAEFARRMTSGSLADFARAHVPGLAASAAVAVQLWFVRGVALAFDLHEFLIVLLGLATSAGTMVLLLRAIARLRPQSDTVWALAAVLRILPPKLRRLAHRALDLRDGAARAATAFGAVAGDLPETSREAGSEQPSSHPDAATAPLRTMKAGRARC